MAVAKIIEDLKKNLEQIQGLHLLQDENIASMERNLEKLKNLTSPFEKKDFTEKGGFLQLMALLELESAAIRSQAAETIGGICEDLPCCQEAALREHLLPKLLHLVDRDPDDMVRLKALFAVSCLTRQSPELQEELAEHDGLAVLLRAMRLTTVPKLRIKATFLLRAFCSQSSSFIEKLYQMGLIKLLVDLLGLDHDECQEHYMSLLLAMATNHYPSRQACQEPGLNLKELLHDRITFLAGREEFREEEESCKKLLLILFPSYDHLTQ